MTPNPRPPYRHSTRRQRFLWLVRPDLRCGSRRRGGHQFLAHRLFNASRGLRVFCQPTCGGDAPLTDFFLLVAVPGAGFLQQPAFDAQVDDLAAAIDAVNACAPDMVLVTGDLTDTGKPAEYALLRTDLDRLTAPCFLIPGNHDDHNGMRNAFSDHGYLPRSGALNWAVDAGPLRLIGVDSVVPGQPHGEVSPDSLDWLDRTLAQDRRPTIVAIHHPPFHTGLVAMDRIMCLNGAAVGQVIARHGHVERLVAGHHHRPIQMRWAGTLGQVAPSVAHQIALDFADQDRPEWVFEPPAFLLHRWQDGMGLLTHTAYVGDYGGPQAFVWDHDDPPMS